MPCSWTAASLSCMPVSACVHTDYKSASAYVLTGMPSLPLLLPDDNDDADTTMTTQEHDNESKMQPFVIALLPHVYTALFPNCKSLGITQKTVNQHCVSDNLHPQVKLMYVW